LGIFFARNNFRDRFGMFFGTPFLGSQFLFIMKLAVILFFLFHGALRFVHIMIYCFLPIIKEKENKAS